MIHEPGDFVMSISPFDLKPHTCMVLQTVVESGVARFIVTDGPNEWPTYMVRRVPPADKVKGGKRKPRPY